LAAAEAADSEADEAVDDDDTSNLELDEDADSRLLVCINGGGEEESE
jgi:hypothetical protein